MPAPHDSNPLPHRSANRPERPADYDLAVAVWRRRKWLAIGVAAAGIAAATSVVVSLPDIYRASATVLVERQQVSEAFVRQSVTAELETRIQTIHRQMMSRARLSDLITRLNLYPELRGKVPVHALVERMREEVTLSLSGVEQMMTGRTATIAFNVGYSGRDAGTVATVVNTLVEAYVNENTRSREQQAARTAEFLKSQLDAVKQELSTQERRAAQFKERHTAELPQQLEANLSALDRFSTRLRLNSEYQLRALERRDRLDRELRSAPAAKGAIVDAAAPVAQLEKLKAALVELRRKYSDRYPDVVRVKAEIAALERDVPSDKPGTDAPATPVADEDPERRLTAQALSDVERDLEALRQEERLLRQVIGTYEARVENAPKRSDELELLSRDYVTSKDRYDTLLKRYEEAQLAENLEQGKNVEQFRVLDPAIPPGQPTAPNRLWLLVMGLMASLGLGFVAMVVAERLDTTFHSLEELRTFANVPTVAAIRLIPTHAQARGLRLRAALIAASAIVAIVLIAAGSHYFAAGNESLVRMTARGAQ
jgi:polysaccharide biosynthesis transport protein